VEENKARGTHAARPRPGWEAWEQDEDKSSRHVALLEDKGRRTVPPPRVSHSKAAQRQASMTDGEQTTADVSRQPLQPYATPFRRSL
jgi:hypothetical protein